MLRQDYLLDLIAQAAALLARLLGQGHASSPLPALDAAAQAWTGISLQLADRLDEGSLRAALGTGERADLQAGILGMLLAGWGHHLLQSEGAHDAGRAALQKGLALMQRAQHHLATPSAALQIAIQDSQEALSSSAGEGR